MGMLGGPFTRQRHAPRFYLQVYCQLLDGRCWQLQRGPVGTQPPQPAKLLCTVAREKLQASNHTCATSSPADSADGVDDKCALPPLDRRVRPRQIGGGSSVHPVCPSRVDKTSVPLRHLMHCDGRPP